MVTAQRFLKKLIFLILLTGLFHPNYIWAACVQGTLGTGTGSGTTTPDETSVDECLGYAVSGDTVNVSAGDGAESWGSVSVPDGVSLIGPGAASLTITGSDVTINDDSRISGFKFLGTGINTSSCSSGWRIDNNIIDANSRTSTITGVDINWAASSCYEMPLGLIDNNEFYNARIVSVSASLYRNYPWYDNYRDMDDTSRTVFIEDNYIDMQDDASMATDCSVSSRLVVRYNTILAGGFEAHGARDRRGCQNYSIYGNDIDNAGNNGNVVGNIRGGTGVIFDNDCDSSGDCGWQITTERCYTGYGNVGQCGDTDFDTRPHPDNAGAYLCRDFTAGQDASADHDEDGTTWPDDQQSKPYYFWNNTEGGTGPWDHLNLGCDSTQFAHGTHFFWDAEKNAGTVNGVQSGLWADRPGTCTDNEGYWATDKGGNWNTSNGTANDGALYVCTSNAWGNYAGQTDATGSYPRYTPETYPHPLRGDSGDTTPPVNQQGIKLFGVRYGGQ